MGRSKSCASRGLKKPFAASLRGQASLGIERSLGSFLELKSRWMPRWDQGPVKSKQ